MASLRPAARRVFAARAQLLTLRRLTSIAREFTVIRPTEPRPNAEKDSGVVESSFLRKCRIFDLSITHRGVSNPKKHWNRHEVELWFNHKGGGCVGSGALDTTALEVGPNPSQRQIDSVARPVFGFARTVCEQCTRGPRRRSSFLAGRITCNRDSGRITGRSRVSESTFPAWSLVIAQVELAAVGGRSGCCHSVRPVANPYFSPRFSGKRRSCTEQSQSRSSRNRLDPLHAFQGAPVLLSR